jgi:hypothetical protein
MIRKEPAQDLIRGENRFSENACPVGYGIMPRQMREAAVDLSLR